jgi:predicted lactoylglutathione lyase
MPPKLAKKIFVHLPVSNIEASTRFYTAIGASKNFLFSDEETSCMAFSSFINVMIMGHDRFKSLCPDVTLVGDSTVIKEVLLCLSADSKEEVRAVVRCLMS